MGSLRIPVSQMVAMTPVSRADGSTFPWASSSNVQARPLSGNIVTGIVSGPNNPLQAFRAASGNAGTGLYIYKGTPPSASVFETNVTGANGQPVLGYRSADLLFRCLVQPNTTVVNSAASLVVPLFAAVATASGTASWFILTSQPDAYGTSSYGVAYYNAVMGTISTPSAGGDIELETTTIVSGQTYNIASITVPLPLNFVV